MRNVGTRVAKGLAPSRQTTAWATYASPDEVSPPQWIRVLACLTLLALGGVVPAYAEEAATQKSAETDLESVLSGTAATATPKSTAAGPSPKASTTTEPKKPTVASPEIFKPTEDISEDVPVRFPIDI